MDRLKFTLPIDIEFELDFKFWALIPNINLNLRPFIIEIEFLCFAIYINFFNRPFKPRSLPEMTAEIIETIKKE